MKGSDNLVTNRVFDKHLWRKWLCAVNTDAASIKQISIIMWYTLVNTSHYSFQSTTILHSITYRTDTYNITLLSDTAQRLASLHNYNSKYFRNKSSFIFKEFIAPSHLSPSSLSTHWWQHLPYLQKLIETPSAGPNCIPFNWVAPQAME